ACPTGICPENNALNSTAENCDAYATYRDFSDAAGCDGMEVCPLDCVMADEG
ncbi:unnamed protein product, partial [Amoebophrya sp. A120]